MEKITVGVDGMMCGHCEAHVNDAVRNAFKVKKEWVGHSIKALNFRSRYNVNILGTKTGDDRTSLMPTADYVFEKDVHLLVVGTREDVLRIIKKI